MTYKNLLRILIIKERRIMKELFLICLLSFSLSIISGGGEDAASQPTVEKPVVSLDHEGNATVSAPMSAPVPEGTEQPVTCAAQFYALMIPVKDGLTRGFEMVDVFVSKQLVDRLLACTGKPKKKKKAE